MRVITVRQPYAWAIMHGGKDVEKPVAYLSLDRLVCPGCDLCTESRAAA